MTRLGIGGERSDSKADDADFQARMLLPRGEHLGCARLRTVIRKRFSTTAVIEELPAMLNAAVDHHADGVRTSGRRLVADGDDPIEVSLGKDRRPAIESRLCDLKEDQTSCDRGNG